MIGTLSILGGIHYHILFRTLWWKGHWLDSTRELWKGFVGRIGVFHRPKKSWKSRHEDRTTAVLAIQEAETLLSPLKRLHLVCVTTQVKSCAHPLGKGGWSLLVDKPTKQTRIQWVVLKTKVRCWYRNKDGYGFWSGKTNKLTLYLTY